MNNEVRMLVIKWLKRYSELDYEVMEINREINEKKINIENIKYSVDTLKSNNISDTLSRSTDISSVVENKAISNVEKIQSYIHEIECLSKKKDTLFLIKKKIKKIHNEKMSGRISQAIEQKFFVREKGIIRDNKYISKKMGVEADTVKKYISIGIDIFEKNWR